ncbi:glycosyltransferase [Enterococcus sp. LJL99]
MTTYILHFNNTIEPGYPYWSYGAVGKWRKDFETFATEIGAEMIRGFKYHWPDEPADVLSARLDGLLGGLKKNDIVIVHWAFAIGDERWIRQFTQRIKLFQAYIVFMISDIESWRIESSIAHENVPISLTMQQKKEVELLSLADGLILHSVEMKKRLEKQFNLASKSLEAKISYIGPYGYKTTYYKEKRVFSKSIDYAGSFEKAKFLLSLPEIFQVNAFGAIKDECTQLSAKKNITVYERMDPEGIPFILNGAFGLVWDSDSYPEVTGPFGKYQLVNTPGKLPLYLASDQPVIIWSKAPLAKYVAENNLGFVLDDLGQLPRKMDELTEEMYVEMCENVRRISPLIRQGTYIKKAILEIQVALLSC